MATSGTDLACGGHRRLLQTEEDGTSAPMREAMGGKSIEYLVKGDLHFGERFHARKSGTEDVGTADDAGGVLASFVIALVVVTEVLGREVRASRRGCHLL